MESIFIDLDDRTSENIITKKLAEPSDTGQSEVSLEIKNAPNKKTENLMVNVRLFSKIKEIQDLPDWVIVKLLLAEGNLGNTDFNDRILND